MTKPSKSTASKLPEIQFLVPERLNEFGEQVTSAIGTDGKEYPDPVPTAPPIGYQNPPDLMTMIRTMIHSEALRQELAQQELETFEEADDFDIEDDPVDPLTEYEKVFLPNPNAPPLNPATPAAAGVAPTPPAAPAGNPEVLDTSGVDDTSSKPQLAQPAKTPAGKAV
ncbi:MAG: hypothetical protein [Microviridae sp.]|nr:MAG: hypothetical protein [Microviridae sp.]